VTVPSAEARLDRELAARRIGLYLDAIRRHGGLPTALAARSSPSQQTAALASMDGLLLAGGGDIDPARYGQDNQGSIDIDADRDELEAGAWSAAEARGVPVLGICRGLQAMNVFSGGSLLQDVGGHAGPGWGTGPALTHPLRVVPGSRLARSLGDPDRLEVNAYHHQGILAADLAPGLVAAAWADSPAGPLVEGLEAPGERFVVGVQCHPERVESTPPEFERLFAAFVAAAATTASATRSDGEREQPVG
jgi:gamma-glutamyl-gamma-aminobutyrate hydrolase PuuD